MTPEERFQKIEKLLNFVAEHQAHFAEQQTQLAAGLDAQRIQHDREIKEIRELQRAMAAGLVRLQEEGVRQKQSHEEAVKEWREGMQELREVQKITEEKLNALIETVDRIIRDRNSKS